jgi:hypothetical protein
LFPNTPRTGSFQKHVGLSTDYIVSTLYLTNLLKLCMYAGICTMYMYSLLLLKWSDICVHISIAMVHSHGPDIHSYKIYAHSYIFTFIKIKQHWWVCVRFTCESLFYSIPSTPRWRRQKKTQILTHKKRRGAMNSLGEGN